MCLLGRECAQSYSTRAISWVRLISNIVQPSSHLPSSSDWSHTTRYNLFERAYFKHIPFTLSPCDVWLSVGYEYGVCIILYTCDEKLILTFNVQLLALPISSSALVCPCVCLSVYDVCMGECAHLLSAVVGTPSYAHLSSSHTYCLLDTFLRLRSYTKPNTMQTPHTPHHALIPPLFIAS